MPEEQKHRKACKSVLENKGIPIGDHRARQLRKSDYEKYDLIIGMDEETMLSVRGDVLFPSLHQAGGLKPLIVCLRSA